MSSRAKKKLNAGVGAQCSILMKYLHPRKLIQEKIVNAKHSCRLEGLVAVKVDTKTINRKKREVIIFHHDTFPNCEIYCAKKFCIVKEEGAEKDFFMFSDGGLSRRNNVGRDNNNPNRINNNEDRERREREEQIPIPIGLKGRDDEDIVIMRNRGILVEDDNDPLPDNIPAKDRVPPGEELYPGQTWGWSGLDDRKVNNGKKTKPRIRGLDTLSLEKGMITFLQIFLLLLPKQMVQIIIAETNKIFNLTNTKKITYGEFLRWLGIQLLMSTCAGHSCRSFWSMKPVSPFEGAPYCMNEYMSGRRFEAIRSNLVFTSNTPPSYRDKFWEVREMIDIWNQYMGEIFCPSWVSCLDESMSPWHGQYTCPGFVYCPRKPHPFGNEYHDICCSECGINYQIELVEGKDAPIERPKDANEVKYGKTTALVLRLCQPIYNSGRVVILDSGFCVLKAIIQLRKVGVYASAVIKKRCYWPSYVKGDVMNKHMSEKQLGECDCIKGEMDGVAYNLFCMRDVDYVSKMMTTYGGLVTNPDCVPTTRTVLAANGSTERKPFQYMEPFDNHYCYRHSVDDHNNLRHTEPSIEGTLIMPRWSLWAFSFILATCEVNAFLAYKYFVCANDASKLKNLTLLEFRKSLSQQLIHNEYLKREEMEEQDNDSENDRRTYDLRSENKDDELHELCTAPKNARNFCHAQKKWICTAATTYPQYKCRHPGCKKTIRTYCSCSIGHWMCKEHHHKHLLSNVAACSNSH